MQEGSIFQKCLTDLLTAHSRLQPIEQVLQNYPYATIRAGVGFVSDSRVRQRERERERDIHIYIYIYIHTHTHTHIHIS